MRHHIPTSKEVRLAEESNQKIASYLSTSNETAIQFINKKNKSEVIFLPTAALQLLLVILSQMAKGNSVTITPCQAELSTQQAADLLNVSRPYFIGLLEEGKIPYRKVGRQRRTRAEDVLNYKKNIDQQRLDVLEQLANDAQMKDMGY